MLETIMNVVRGIQFRGKPRIMRRVVPRQGNIQASVFNARIELDLSNFVDWMIYTGCYEPVNTARFRAILKPGMCAIDVGANIGYFTLLAADLVGKSGRVIAFEPHPTNVEVLTQAVTRSGLRQVEVLPIGLSDAPGVGHVYQADQSVFPNRTASMIGSGDHERRFDVQTDTLDNVLDARDVPQVDLLKVDVDGFEWKVLQGGARSLETRVRNVLIELSPFWLHRASTTEAEVVAWLQARGFRSVPTRWMQNKFLGRRIDVLFSRDLPV